MLSISKVDRMILSNSRSKGTAACTEVDYYLEQDGDARSGNIGKACNESDGNGTPRVDSGASCRDGNKTSKGSIAHHSHIIGHTSCRMTANLQLLLEGILLNVIYLDLRMIMFFMEGKKTSCRVHNAVFCCKVKLDNLMYTLAYFRKSFPDARLLYSCHCLTKESCKLLEFLPKELTSCCTSCERLGKEGRESCDSGGDGGGDSCVGDSVGVAHQGEL